MEKNSNKEKSFYDHYFDQADFEVFRFDVGSFCTRKCIIDHISKSSGNLLEIGTGISSLIIDLQKFSCTGVDISETTIAKVKSQFATLGISADLIVTNAEQLPFQDKSFDVIVSAHTLEHIEYDERVMQECARVLKPGGELIFFVPGRISGLATQDEFKKYGHFRYYNRQRFIELEQHVQESLKLKTIIYPHKVHNLLWNRCKHFFRWVNYPLKKWVFRDNKTYELRPAYQKFLLSFFSKVLDRCDVFTQKTEKNLLGAEFNVLVKFEKL